MITPSQTAALPRRIAASAIDLLAVGILWALVLYRLAVRFEIAERTADGEPIYSEFQRQKLLEIDEGINFGFTAGDYYHSLHGRGLVLGAVALLIFSLIAWVLIPANTGWSVGHRVLGLRVTDLKGQRPPLDSYLRRYLVGLVDLFPYVVPGLLGWIVAGRNDLRQRMGDLSADTVVIPAHVLASFAETPEPAEVRAPQPVPAVADLHSMVDVEEAIAGVTAGAETGDYPVVETEDDAIPAIAVSDIPAAASPGSEQLTSVVSGFAEAEQPPTGGTPESGWLPPESQEAPVWTPEPSAERVPRSTAESGGDAGTSQAPAPAGEPVWNEEWGAWLFWDAEGHRWLRHDERTGWRPIQHSQNVS